MQKLTETEQTELKLNSYLMHIHRTYCRRCGSGEQYQTLFEVWTHPTKTRISGYRDLRPARSQLKDLPMACLELPERPIEICSDCVHTYTCTASPIPSNAASAAAWAETLKRKAQEETKPAEIKIARASQPSAGRKAANVVDFPAPTAKDL